jgi:hypothetical protein
MQKLDPDELQKRRWLKALEIAKVFFDSEGYHTRYLDEIETLIKGLGNGKGQGIADITR